MTKPVDQEYNGMGDYEKSTYKRNRDTKLANPNGDVVDNSAASDTLTVNKTYQMGQKGGNVGFRNRPTGPLYTDGN